MSSQINSCSTCGATWTGEGRAHCAAAGCHRLFSVASLFDAHRKWGKCHDPGRLKNQKGEAIASFRDGVWFYAQTHPRAKDE